MFCQGPYGLEEEPDINQIVVHISKSDLWQVLWSNRTEFFEKTHRGHMFQAEMSAKFEFELKCLSWKINKVGKSLPEKGKSLCDVPNKSVG